MKYPEIKQKGESQEDFVRRISKLPTLSPNTILRVVFQKANKDNLQHIKDWARPMFPKSFPPTDRNGIPFLNPENISTKSFANWVIKENIFEAWKGLGEKPSPIAEQFIDLALGKTNTPTKHLVKPKANQGRWAENNKQKKAARKIAKRLWKQNKDLTIADAILHDDINMVAPNKAESTLRGWIKDLAPSK